MSLIRAIAPALARADALAIRFARTGGVAMLRMMGSSPDGHDHHDHMHGHDEHHDIHGHEHHAHVSHPHEEDG